VGKFLDRRTTFLPDTDSGPRNGSVRRNPLGGNQSHSARWSRISDKAASDGLEADDKSNDCPDICEHSAIRLRSKSGALLILIQDDRILWPDTLSLADVGYLYFMVNQLNRMARFDSGHNLRKNV
jgi:hypothetical protein